MAAGPACLTLHAHAERFTGQENRTIMGSAEPGSETGVVSFRAERALADWSITGGRPRSAVGFLAKGRRLGPRLRAEAQRRFQPVPEVRLPGRG
jgi:hypothetical protein